MNEQQLTAYNVAEKQGQLLLRMRESIEIHNKSTDHSSTYQFERAKLIGMLSVLDALQVDRSTFNWIFN